MSEDTLLAGQLAYCEQQGYDCIKNGANDKNCDFRLFATAAHTQAWERGKRKAERDIGIKRNADGSLTLDLPTLRASFEQPPPSSSTSE